MTWSLKQVFEDKVLLRLIFTAEELVTALALLCESIVHIIGAILCITEHVRGYFRALRLAYKTQNIFRHIMDKLIDAELKITVGKENNS